MSREAKILIAILVIITGGMIALFMLGDGSGKTPSGPTADASKLVREGSHKTGTGAVTMVKFGDYQCPACGQAHPILKQLLKEYDGKVTFVFRNFPLTMHTNAKPAAAAAEAAAKQNKFWEMHDKLYDTQKQWETSTTAAEIFAGYAKDLGLNVDKYKQDVTSAAIQKIVNDDLADAEALKLQSTPSIFIEGKLTPSYQYDTLKDLIDEALKS